MKLRATSITPVFTLMMANNHPGVKRMNYSVNVRTEEGGAPFTEKNDGIPRKFVEEWCTRNLSHGYEVGRYETVFFNSEDDAILFLMAFSG